MRQQTSILRVLVIVGAAVICAGFAWWKYTYPFGRCPGAVSLPGLRGSLLAYAGDHEGWFPNNATNAYEALRLLYPYCPSGRELAGVSGQPEAVAAALRSGQPLNKEITSWRYVPGLRVDDPDNVALVWETKTGLYYDGRRNKVGARAVLLVGGGITNVSARDWENFMEDQRGLLQKIQSERATKTNRPTQINPATR